jgi:peroxisomal 2,4-dienoyl-CoA reductase
MPWPWNPTRRPVSQNVHSLSMQRVGLRRPLACSPWLCPCPLRSFVTGDTLVVDGANWMWKPQVVPRSAVSQVSRGVEAKSRDVGTAAAAGGQAARSKL